MAYRMRVADEQLQRLLALHEAVKIEGARAVGKTTTAVRHAATVFKLEQADTLARVADDPQVLLRAEPPVLIDEWHLYPESMNLVKNAVDELRIPGRFILTGSPAEAPTPKVHTGLGRIVALHMRPMSLAERGTDAPTVSMKDLLTGTSPAISGTTEVGKLGYAEAVLQSGFPGCIGEPAEYSLGFLGGYLARLVKRDMRDIDPNDRQPAPGPLSRWLKGYAQATATEAKFTTIRDYVHQQDGETPARTTIDSYKKKLKAIGVIDEQPAWEQPASPIAKCKTSSLHHLVDPGLAAHLMTLTSPLELIDSESSDSSMAPGTSIFGLLFQSLVTQSVRAYAAASNAEVYWLGTKKDKSRVQREIDILVREPGGKVVAIEVKLSGVVDQDDVKHLRWLRGELGWRWADGLVVNTGSEAYRRDDGIAVVPAALLGP